MVSPLEGMRAGEHVTPQVRLVRAIGAGGMGAVWLADHLALKTQVAVKFILAGRENDAEARERFSREAEAAAQVKSPHVAQIFDHGVAEDGVPFIVMELLEGEDLAKYVQAQGRLGLKEIASIITQICRALGRAHAKGLIHRDVKPANVFLCDVGTPERFVKLLDFGVAKVIDEVSSTKSGAVTGTPVYMAPEQLLGAKGLDHRADLWSVAVVAFELMTGRRPFEEETAAAIALRVHTRGMPRASETMTDLSDAAREAIDRWFEKGWAIRPEDRFESALQLSDTFDALVRLLFEVQGVESTRRFTLQIDRISLPGEPVELTVREKPSRAVSDVTLQSGRVELGPVMPSSKKVEVAPTPSSSPQTETPISKGVRESNAPAAQVVVETPRRARFIAVAALAIAGLVGIGLMVRPRRESNHATPPPPPASPASSSTAPVIVTVTPTVSVTAPIASATTTASISATPLIKRVIVAPVKSAASAPTATKKPLEDIE